MRQLYEQVQVDKDRMRFYAECDISGRRIYSKKLPVLCRIKDLLAVMDEGNVGGFKQSMYNHRKADAIQDLARFFNQCRKCGKWVCDEMFDPQAMECKRCIASAEKE